MKFSPSFGRLFHSLIDLIVRKSFPDVQLMFSLKKKIKGAKSRSKAGLISQEDCF